MNAYDDAGLGRKLWEQGWKQGTLFQVPTTLVYSNDLQVDKDSNLECTHVSHQLGDNERLILITQDCDIVHNKEEYVEALLCFVEPDKGQQGNWEKNSARFFVVDPSANLVAKADLRVVLSKKALELLNPIPWSRSKERLYKFKAWLARRYNRPAIDDFFVDNFQKPATDALGKFFKKNKALHDAFSTAVSEIKLNLPPVDKPPYQLRLVIMTKKDLSSDQAKSIRPVLEIIKESVDKTLIAFDKDLISNEDNISVTDYKNAVPVYLDYFSYKGDEITGLLPSQI